MAIIVIGRNEGERLRRCLGSAIGRAPVVVYVDSGSTDGSVELARGLGASIVELDPSIPFSAGRARNAGVDRVLVLQSEVEFVQFVDGDCELVAEWLGQGVRALRGDPGLAAVCGRVRELNPEKSVYNRLCALEWNAPEGETRFCGGNAMVRVRAFREAGGFDPALIAGEEPELCVRLRMRGWKVARLDSEMVLHDAAMTRFAQWWRRSLRAGWAYAEGAAMHGSSPERHCVRESCSILFWGALLPSAALLLPWASGALGLLLFAGYPLLAARVFRASRRRGFSREDARLQALFIVLAKFPQAIGQLQFASLRVLGKRRRIVEWRGTNQTGGV
jgi:GT2 family glycosyltransferase